ncbi:hypothetical protein BGX27_009074, partial [Mortierella sp. AM989]
MSSGIKKKKSKAESWKNMLGDMPAGPYFESCNSITEFDYLGFLQFSECKTMTKDYWETQWTESLDQLMKNDHVGLQRKGVSLKKLWRSKGQKGSADVFWSKVNRKRRLDKGTLNVQTTVDEYWNTHIRKEYEQEIEDSVPVRNIKKSRHDKNHVHGEADELDDADVEDIISTIKTIEHDDCLMVNVSQCVNASFNLVLAGTFAPFNETPLMQSVFGASQLKRIKESLATDLDEVTLNDNAIQNSIRCKMNNKPHAAEDALENILRRSSD